MKLAPQRFRSWRRVFSVLSAIAELCFFSVSASLGISARIRKPVEPQSRTPVLHVEVDLQPIEVQVKDSHGNDVQGLRANDFTILENGRPQKIAFFNAGNGPVSLAVLVDSSDSMNSDDRLGSAQQIAAQFMRTGRPDDEIFAMDFTDQMGPFQRITQAQLQNPSGVALAPAPSSGSALYDAIATALCHLHISKNLRKAVIVVTDGVDEHSRLTLEQLIQLARSSHAQVFMIDLHSRPDYNFQGHAEPKLTLITGHEIDNPVVVFDRLMKESGAESFIPNSERDLDKALSAVSAMLDSEYTLAYYPQKRPNKKVRKIQVKVDRPRVKILAPRVVGSSGPAAELVHFDPGTCTVSPKEYPYPYEASVMNSSQGIIYRDDFSNPQSGWPDHKDSHYVTRGYELFNPKEQILSSSQSAVTALSPGADAPNYRTKFRNNLIAAYGPWWSDFRASVSMTEVLDKVSHQASVQYLHNSTPAAGLVFRMNVNGYYALLVNNAKNQKHPSVELVRRVFEGSFNSYNEVAILPWIQLPKESSTSATKLGVEAVGAQISIFITGERLETVHDDTFDQGLVGFIISGPGQAIFRDLAVEQK